MNTVKQMNRKPSEQETVFASYLSDRTQKNIKKKTIKENKS